VYRTSDWNIVAIVLKLVRVCYSQARWSYIKIRLHTAFIALASAVVDGFECVSEHAPRVEINLTFTTHRSGPLPLEYDIQNDVTYHEIEWLDEYRRLFTSSLE
jgi:hypothetical protein